MDSKVGSGIPHLARTSHSIAPEFSSETVRTAPEGLANVDGIETQSAPEKKIGPYASLEADLTALGNLRGARIRELASQSGFTKLKNFFFGDPTKGGYDAKVDALFRQNPKMAVHELSAGDWGKNSSRYLHFDAEGNLSVRDSKPNGFNDTAALKALSYWLLQHSTNVNDEQFDSLKDTLSQLYQRGGRSRPQDEAYAQATRALYAANPERAKSELLAESDDPRFVTFDELGNAAIHNVRPRGYDYTKELSGFQRWVENSQTELSKEEARSALSAYRSLESDARANLAFFGQPDWEEKRTAATDAVYRKAPSLAHEEIGQTDAWGKLALGEARYLHVSSDGKSTSVREQRPKSHSDNFRGLTRYIATLDPADSNTPRVIAGIQKYVEEFGKEAWPSNQERDAALAQLQAQAARKNAEGAKVQTQNRASRAKDSDAEP